MLFGKELRQQSFPIFSNSPEHAGKQSSPNLCYLDSAASTQKPATVIQSLSDYLSYQHANVHRGAYRLSAMATERFEQSRTTVASFLNAQSSRNIIFTKGATDSVNLAAFSIEDHLQKGDHILLTILEHHSNIVPWQILAKRKGLNISFVDILDNGQLNLQDYENKLSSIKPKVVAITALANSIGTVNPIEELVAQAKKIQAIVLVDAAQYSAHKPTDVKKIGCDFLVFSAHKLYGPTGCGVLYCSDSVLEKMSPVYGGGEMISSVTTEGSTWAEIPHRFEAGTPAIAEVIALEPAIKFISSLFSSNISQFERKIFEAFYQALASEPGVTIYGTETDPEKHASIIAFNVEAVHAHDLSSIADSMNVQIRAGHHCAQPLMRRLAVNATARVSLACYSDMDQIQPLIESIRYAKKVFGG